MMIIIVVLAMFLNCRLQGCGVGAVWMIPLASLLELGLGIGKSDVKCFYE
jgi:hypothetical protein